MSGISKFNLWFFRDMIDDQRLALFSIFEMPVGEIGKIHSHQRRALKCVLRDIAEPTASAVVPQLGGAPDDLHNLIKVVFAEMSLERMGEVCKQVISMRKVPS